MTKSRVQLFGFTGKYALVNTDANEGAVVGVDLRWSDGSPVSEALLRAALKPVGVSAPDTTDDIDEGQYNRYFTDQRAQDAIGSILIDTDTVKFTYDPTGHTIKADAAPSFVPYFVPNGTVFIVPVNAQALWTIPIELDGDAGLEIDGALVEVN